MHDQGFQERLAVGEVAIERGSADAGRGRDRGEVSPGAVLREHVRRGVEQRDRGAIEIGGVR